MIALLLAAYFMSSTSAVWVVDSHTDLPLKVGQSLRTQSVAMVKKSGLLVSENGATRQNPTESCLADPVCLQKSLRELTEQSAGEETALFHVQALRVGDKIAVVCRVHNELGGVVAQDQSWAELTDKGPLPTLTCPQSAARLARLGQTHRVVTRAAADSKQIKRATNANEVVGDVPDTAPVSSAGNNNALNGWILGGAGLSTLMLGGGATIALSQNALRIDPTADGDQRASTSTWIPVGASIAVAGALGLVSSLIVFMVAQNTEQGEAS